MPQIEVEIKDFGQFKDFTSDSIERKLSGTPIRFTYDDTLLQSNNLKEYQQSIQTALETAFNFYRKFMKVKIPTPENFQITKCSKFTFDKDASNSNVVNSDMHFIVNALYDTENWIARAGYCMQQKQDNRPIVGLVEFNTQFLPSQGQAISNYEFKNVLAVTIHELFHALCFNKNAFSQFVGVDSSMFNIAEGTQPWVAFPNVLQFAKTHFGCDSITKVYLEDDGGNISAGSHWERTLFYNDLMTASLISGESTWSGINNALIKDSGWYDVDLEFHNQFLWGKNKGCDFYNKQCQANPLPEEFCNPSDDSAQKIGFNFSGIGYCSSSDSYLDNSCNYFTTKSKYMCQDPNNNSVQDKTLQVMRDQGSIFGWESKGVISSLSLKQNNLVLDKQQVMCYPQKCIMNGNAQNIEFQIGASKTKVVCENNGQEITHEGYDGRLLCPNISDFCQKQYSCENECNQGGFCMKQICYCTPGFSGPSCQCGNGQFYKENMCVKCNTDKCISCNEKDECIKCQQGYALDEKMQCQLQESSTFSPKLIIKFMLLILFALF